jgi:hypothetical protein
LILKKILHMWHCTSLNKNDAFTRKGLGPVHRSIGSVEILTHVQFLYTCNEEHWTQAAPTFTNHLSRFCCILIFFFWKVFQKKRNFCFHLEVDDPRKGWSRKFLTQCLHHNNAMMGFEVLLSIIHLTKTKFNETPLIIGFFILKWQA